MVVRKLLKQCYQLLLFEYDMVFTKKDEIVKKCQKFPLGRK